MVSDVTRMGEWSPETEVGVWLGGVTGPQRGAKFRGTNRNGTKKWKTVAKVVDCEPGRAFAFCIGVPGLKIAEWRYEFEPTATGCRVTETWTDLRRPGMPVLGKLVSGVADRAAHNRVGMEETLERLKAAAESRA
jgi:hypothetical protein